MDNIEIKNRLKEVEKLDPLVILVNQKVIRSFQKDNNIRFYIKDLMNKLLKELYEPLGYWGQSPSEKKEKHFGVVKDNYWMEVNQFDTNHSTHILLFNRVNKFIVSYFRKFNTPLKINQYIFTPKDQFQFDENYYKDYKKTKSEIDRFFVILNHYRDKIFLPGNDIYDVMVNICRSTMERGQKAQDFYVSNINEIFDDITNIKSVKERGEYDDMTKGVDVWTKHKDDKIITHQVKSVCQIHKTKDGYVINTIIPPSSRCNYFVFVCIDERILIFSIDYSKIRINKGEETVFFDNDLLYFDKTYK